MFRAIATILTVTAALSASMALAGDYMFRGDAYGSYHSQGGRYETDYCDDYQDDDCHIDYVEHCRHKPRYVEQVFVKPAYNKAAYCEPSYCEPSYCKPAYCEPIRQKQICVEPIRVQKVCVEPIRVKQIHVQPVHVKQVCVEPVYVKQVHVERQCVKPMYREEVCVEPQTYCYYRICYKNPCWDYQKDMTFDCLDEAKEMCHELQSKGYRIALLKCDDDGYGRGGRGEFEGRPRGRDNFEVGFRNENFLID